MDAQEAEKISEHFLLNAEMRPRVEFTSNYVLPPNDSLDPYFYITQRNRISALYEKEKWLIKSDLQEIHLWDENNKASKVGSINFYQLYIETKFKSFNFRLGRQSILLDNGRLFSDAPWAQQGRAHEGIRIMYDNKDFSNDFFGLFTRNYNTEFDAAYSPVASNRYKYILVNSFNYNFNKRFAFNTITSVDFFKRANTDKMFARATIGGRFDFKHENWFYTLNSYFQFGRTPQGKSLSAFYLQPETRFTINQFTFRLGTEIISGTSSENLKDYSNDFDVLYGVTWKFNGNMNIFTRFPVDVKGKGLINPYFFTLYSLNKKLSLRTDLHLFYSQYPILNKNEDPINKYLGFENDISLKYTPIKQIEINYGFSFYKTTNTMAYLPKIDNDDKTAFWSYLMVSYSFNIVNKNI
jgi:hypothetical protein